MILLLFSCSNNLLKAQIQSGKPVASSTGSLLRTDTSKVVVPVSFIKDANAKLLERIYLIKVNAQQDSIINLNKQYAAEQAKIIKDFQGRVVNLTNDNNSLRQNVTKLKRTNKTLATVIGVGIVSLAGVLILK